MKQRIKKIVTFNGKAEFFVVSSFYNRPSWEDKEAILNELERWIAYLREQIAKERAKQE